MPEMIVRIVGDTSSLERSYKRAAAGTSRFTKEVERAGRGASVAAVGFHGLGRSIGFASAQFLGGAGFVYAIKSTIDAAEESQRVLAQTKVAVEDSGLSWEKYSEQIQAAAKATSQLSGFDDERLLATFSTLVRRTGDVNKALRLNALAADVARGRNIELEQATQLVLKASLGQAGALRRLGIDAAKNATALQLLDLLQRRYAGSAKAYGDTAAGAQDRFRVAVENLQEELGQTLLPSITRVLNRTSAWLDDEQNRKKVVDDFAASVHVLAVVTGNAARTAGQLYDAWSKLNDLFRKVPGAPGGLGDIIKKGIPNLPGYGIYTGIKAFQRGTAADRAGGDPFALIRGSAFQLQWQTAAALAEINRPGAGSPFGADVPRPSTPLTAAQRARRIDQRNQWFDAMVSRMLGDVVDIPTLKGQIARLKQIADLVLKAQGQVKDATRKINLGETYKEIQRTIRGDQQQIDQTARDAAKARKQREREAAAARVAASIARRLGWAEFGVERAQATEIPAKILRALKVERRVIQEIIKERGATLERRRQLFDVNQQIRDLDKQEGMKATAFRHYNVDALAAMIGLPGDRRAMAILAQIGKGGTMPVRGRAFAGTGGTVINIGTQHNHGITDVPAFENAMVKQGRAKAHNRRGAR